MTRLALLLALLATPATAQQQVCELRPVMIEALETRFGETVQSAGLAPNNILIEMIANLETGTWTLMVTRPDGVSCVFVVGTNYMAAPQPKGEAL